MAGLQWPIVGHATTQGFTGTNPFEPAGFLIRDASGPRRARVRAFAGGVAQAHLHAAIDIGCPIGTEIHAPEAGRIVAAGVYDSTGERYMMLQVKPGTILFFTHLKAFVAGVGQHVARGDVIGRTGNSGMSTGPHLHWEVRVTTNPDADFRRSAHWFKWNPNRLRVGGDLAGLAAIRPPGAPPEAAVEAAVDTAVEAAVVEIATDPDPVEAPSTDPQDLEPDTVGDVAALLDRVPGLVGLTGEPQEF
jgi:murein DD-endopeptidase MepM/ murein hydrolase activator NlpD